MWTTERPTEEGFYWYGHAGFLHKATPVRLFEQSGDWFVIYLASGQTLPAEIAQGYWGPRIPSPDKLAALERLAEADAAHMAVLDRLFTKHEYPNDDIMAELQAAAEAHRAALDAVREAKW